MYADYAFYTGTYNGALTEAEYNRLSVLATAHINRITNGRAGTATGRVLDAVKMAECAIIDELGRQEQGGIVTAESNDGVSRSYATSAVVKSATQRIYSVAEVFLCNTNLLYVGI